MQAKSVFMSSAIGGVLLGGLLAAVTPTDILDRPGTDWRSRLPHHPDPAALVSRDVTREYVAFDYANERYDAANDDRYRSDLLMAASFAPVANRLDLPEARPRLIRAATPAAEMATSAAIEAAAEARDAEELSSAQTQLAAAPIPQADAAPPGEAPSPIVYDQ